MKRHKSIPYIKIHTPFHTGRHMASGRKNYFRHSFFAHEDEKLQKIIDKLGFEGYGYYFALLELCGRQCTDEVKNPITLHLQSLRSVWRKQSKSCIKVLKELEQSGLFVVTFKESLVELDIPNFSKYLGKYTNKKSPNSSNKIKENKIKLNKMKGKENTPLEHEVINLFNSILAGNGRVQHYAGFSLPPKAREEYTALCGFKGFQTEDDFISYFELIRSTPKLIGTDEKFNINITLPWILQADNAIKIKIE